MRAISMCLVLVLASCDTPVELALDLEVEVEGETDESVPVAVGEDGTVEVTVRICVPGLDSAQVRVSDLRRSGDAGVAVQQLLLVGEPVEEECGNRLRGSLDVPAPVSGPLELEVAVLGERVDISRMLIRQDSVTLSEGAVSFDPDPYGSSGGIVTVVVAAPSAADGTPVSLRALPSSVQIASAMRPVANGSATFTISVPDDVASVWAEARLGQSRAEAIVQRSAP